MITDTPAPQGAALSSARIAASSGSSFLIGFRCLPAARRRAMTAVYAFCRVADDAVDEAANAAVAAAHLDYWRRELDLVESGAPATPVGRELQQVLKDFGGSTQPFRELLAGMEMDLRGIGYADLAALEVYCHRVASAPGLACLPVLGATSEGAREYAEWLGRALQLTNILRDLSPDAREGRVYAPRDWLLDCGVEVEWLAGGGPAEARARGGALACLCDRFAATARERFARADAALRRLTRVERRRLVPARIMGAVYRDLLGRLERRGGELCGERVRVSKGRRVWLALTMLLGVRG